MIEIVFWFSVVLVVYTYVAFPILLYVRPAICRKPLKEMEYSTAVSVIIAAYNEADVIGDRIENILSLDYPTELVDIIVASDGSDDETEAIVARQPHDRVRLLSLSRQGKASALNAAVTIATGELLVFTDANTRFRADTLRNLVGPFSDPEVGGVAGNQVYERNDQPSPSADGECARWNFDRRQEQWQSAAGSVTSATGSIYAIRRELFSPIPTDAMDDFFVSTGVVAQGFRLVFAVHALSFEAVAVTGDIEFSRKVRVITQGLRAVWYRRNLLNPLRYGFYSVQLATHKVLRRLMVFPLILIFATNVLLWPTGLIYQVGMAAQCALYGAAIIGAVAQGAGHHRARVFSLAYYFCMVNLAALLAVVRLLGGQKIRGWEPERHGCSQAARPSSRTVESTP